MLHRGNEMMWPAGNAMAEHYLTPNGRAKCDAAHA
jgi:hypothetical protein